MTGYRIVDAAELARIYRGVTYSLVGPAGTGVFVVGQPATAAEALVDAGSYAFVTAYNPASRPRSEAENRDADARLLQRLREAGARSLWPMRAHSEDAAWDEPGWLVGDLPLTQVDAIAREFGQAATLAWQRGAPVRLRMYLPRPAATVIADVDWVE